MKRADIELLLPAIFRSAASNPSSVIGLLLDVMEELHRQPDSILAEVDAYFDPYRTPDRFVTFLARWVDLDRFFDRSFRDDVKWPEDREPISTGLGRLRELIRQAAYLSKWRGTRKGLQAFLETAVGIEGFEVLDEHARPFQIRVRIPEAARPHQELIDRIVRAEKPASVTYRIEFFSP